MMVWPTPFPPSSPPCRYTNTGSGVGATRHCSVKGGPFDGLEYREVKVGEGSTGGYSYTIDQVSWLGLPVL